MRKNKRIYVALLMAFISCLFVGCKGDPIEKDEGISVPPAQSVTLSAENKSVYEGEAVDILSLFTVYVDGEEVAVTMEMLDLGELQADAPAVGIYTVKLRYLAADKRTYIANALITVLPQNAENDDATVVITSIGKTIEGRMPFDVTTLFSIEVNGEEVPVTESMLSMGAFTPEKPTEGTYMITLTYVLNGKTYEETVALTVVGGEFWTGFY